MASLRPAARSAATLDKDRVSLCRFTVADGRQCRTPRASNGWVAQSRDLSLCALCVSAPLCDNRFPFISSPCPLCPLCVLCVSSFPVFPLFSPLLFRPIEGKNPHQQPPP